MAEREDNVYKAKLAEQAERYEGNGALVPCWWAWLVVLYCILINHVTMTNAHNTVNKSKVEQK